MIEMGLSRLFQRLATLADRWSIYLFPIPPSDC
jgi:hypothetical protein